MSPISKTTLLNAGELYVSPFDEVESPIQLLLDKTNLTTAEVDAYGYLKPGLPLNEAGDMPIATEFVYGCVAEAVKVAASNSAADIAAIASGTTVTVYRAGSVRQGALESILGRVLTAAEIAGFDLAGSQFALLKHV